MMQDSIAPAPIQYYRPDQLYLSDLNPRQDADAEGIELLADSLAAIGLIQNLSGITDTEGKIGIVAGGRRLRAILRAIERDPAVLDRQPTLAQVPVQITADEETARAWASVENAAREDLHPADEIRSYGRMKTAGAEVSAIARVFGKTEAHVYRRLALAALPAEVLDALKANEITIGVARAFTLSNDAALTLQLLDEVRGRDVSEHRIRQALQPDAVNATDRRARFIGLALYEAAGGTLTRDLFSEHVALHNPDILDRVFKEKLAEDAAKACDGWRWFDVLDSSYVPYGTAEKMARIYRVEGDLTEAEQGRYDELAELYNGDALDAAGEAELDALQAVLDGDHTREQRAFAGWFVCVSNDGELRLDGPYVKPEDKKAATDAGVLAGHAAYREERDGGDQEGAETSAKPAISMALADDLSRIAMGARQHAALRDADLLLDLFAYQMSHALQWRKPFGISTAEVPNWPTTEAEGYELDKRLTSEPPRDMYSKDLAKSFRAFRKKGADHVRGELIRFLAAHYRGGDEQLSALVDKETKPAIREVWTPTAANFFSRVGGPYLNDLWRDLLDLRDDHPTATTFTKLKKAEKAAKLEALFSDPASRSALGVTAEQAERIDAWLPHGME